MRNRVILAAFAVAALAGAVGVLVLRDGSEPPPPAEEEAATIETSSSLPPQVVSAGGVDVTIEPIRLDDTGAVFLVTLDTHSVDLGVDLARVATLAVDGIEWLEPSWSGDPPGGHHRQGELSFEPAGSASGTATLTIAGFPEPLEAAWSVGVS